MRFCIAETQFAYRKLRSRLPAAAWAGLLLCLGLPASGTELRPEVLNAIRQAAEAASAPAPRYPVLPPLRAPSSVPALPPALTPAPTPAPTPALKPAPKPTSSAAPAAPPAPPPARASDALRLQAPAPARPAPAWAGVARSEGRLQAADIGLVINTADPYSVAVGEHYIRRRGLKPNQVLRLVLPTGTTLTRDEFEHLRGRISLRFGRQTQALALAWVRPYAVECNSISGALAMGFDAALCENSCKPSRPSKYFNASTAQPFTDLGLRPSMLLAAPSIEAARELIDRGALSDGSLALRDRQPVSVMLLLNNADPARSVRTQLYPPAGPVAGMGVNVRVEPAFVLPAAKRVLLVSTGAVRLDFPEPLDWVPGGLGDHLTSYGGALDPWHGQSTALEWIASGATASHGSVSEPCNHLQKFPHPQVLLLHYLQGATALEAYWKSVAWPQQSLFIGEPLAAPFAVPDWARASAKPVAPPANPAAATEGPASAAPVTAPATAKAAAPAATPAAAPIDEPASSPAGDAPKTTPEDVPKDAPAAPAPPASSGLKASGPEAG